MHEMSIAQSLVDIIKQEMSNHGVTKLLRVKVKHGVMSTVVPEALSFSFEVLTRDTPLDGAILQCESVPMRVRCRGCGKEFQPEIPDFLCMPCPGCGEEFNHEILSGKELYIENIEAE